MSLLYKAEPERGREWQGLFAKLMPQMPVHVWPDTGDLAEVRYLAAWQFTPEIIESLPNLEVIFSVGAGADQFDLRAVPDSVQIVRMIDPSIAQGMGEYITFATLYLHRDMAAYHRQQAERTWHEIRLLPPKKRTVGIMGLGEMGQAAIDRLRPFGFQLRGWSKSLRMIEGVETFAGTGGLEDFLGGCNILICLLPLTAETSGIMCRDMFDRLPKGAGIINAGRGGHLVEADLLAALDSGQISGAVIDVVSVEPAPKSHPFFAHPRIFLTPHIATMTDPQSAALVLLENVRRHLAGETMIGRIDRQRGY